MTLKGINPIQIGVLDLNQILDQAFDEVMVKKATSQIYEKIEMTAKNWIGNTSTINMPSCGSFGCTDRQKWWVKFAEHYGSSPIPHTLKAIIAKRLKEEKSPGLALDVGCGNSGAAFYLLKGGWQVIVIDNNPDVLKVFEKAANVLNSKWLASKQLILVCKKLEDVHKLTKQVDVIVASHILNYCNPLKIKIIWDNLYTFLKPGGHIVGDFRRPRNVIPKPLADIVREMGQWIPEKQNIAQELLKEKGYKTLLYEDGTESEPFMEFFIGEK